MVEGIVSTNLIAGAGSGGFKVIGEVNDLSDSRESGESADALFIGGGKGLVGKGLGVTGATGERREDLRLLLLPKLGLGLIEAHWLLPVERAEVTTFVVV